MGTPKIRPPHNRSH